MKEIHGRNLVRAIETFKAVNAAIVLIVLLLAGCGTTEMVETSPTPPSTPTSVSTILPPTPLPTPTSKSTTPTSTTEVITSTPSTTTDEPAAATVPPVPDGLSLPPDYTIELVVSDLRGPTQMIEGPDGRLWVAQLNGRENDGTGQLLAIDLATGERQLLLADLFKPTGLALLEQTVWIAAGRDLLRAPLLDTGAIGPLETVLAELPFNGRSNGTLTVSPDGRLLFETSGRRSGNRASTGSATLWALDPDAPDDPQPLATGLKGAYAHTFDSAGRLWTTEIGDDLVNGAAPPDELNWVIDGADFGWPACFGQQEPALNFGGTEAQCQATRAPVVIFPPRSTPTSIVASPWADDVLLVALWGPSERTVGRIAVTVTGDNATGTYDVFLRGLQTPQHLLVLPDQSLLVSDFSAGKIYQIRPR
ncbi:MAG: PQQ-dependent sugar dehydrogenase [Anaerolineae bacterium]|nr:PQQ-dependent sugar dehydrogenase [Anaerolineae bacterium]